MTLNILDQPLIKKLEKKSKEQLSKLFYIKPAEKDKERTIRKNKVSKDRYEELKIKSLV
jgi:hypothetical protein